MLIVATAGHIDHGKTSLVRALTGVDTDRLPEERARGISIDLGFAYWEAEPGLLVAFVDVPGHHRFIRNMLAGVAAIHYAVLVVAVDDGPMPQTVEHVQILDYLGVGRGVVVLSKADLAAPQRVAEVEASVRDLLAGTTLAGVPTLAASARSGAGLPELKALLAREARRHEQERAADASGRRARFSIDRVFSVRGAGTVVTGTVVDGQVACEDRLSLSAGEPALRVRGIQVHGREVKKVASGERAAINITGLQPAQAARGDWLTDPATAAAGHLMDVSIAVLPGDTPLRHASQVRMYLGASEAACRVLLQGRGEIGAGQRRAARLHLETPVVAVNGDRFVLRDGSGSRTLGGGTVVDPWPASRRRHWSPAEFEALAGGQPEAALAAMLAVRGKSGIELARFERIFNLTEARRNAVIAAEGAVVLGKAHPLVVPKARVDEVAAQAAAALQHDDRSAIPLAELRQSVAAELPLEAFESLLRDQAERLDITLAGGAVALRQRKDSMRSTDVAAWQSVRPLLAQAVLDPPELAELARRTGVATGRLRAILHTQGRAGDVFQLRPDRYVVRELVAQLATAAAETAAQFPDGRFTAAQYRDRIGTGRTLAIHVLEMLDVCGITRRIGDQRTMLRNPEAVFGAAKAYRAAVPPPQPPTAARPGGSHRAQPVRR